MKRRLCTYPPCGLPLKDYEIRAGLTKHRHCYGKAKRHQAAPPPELYPVGYGAWTFWLPLVARQPARRLGARL